MGPRTPHSEKLVKQWLADDPRASRFTVYHSHGLGAHEKKPHGEIDFVVLVPPDGVITVEVKGDQISRKNGRWHQRGGNYAKDIDDPVAQMVSNQHEFARVLKNRLKDPGDSSAVRYAGILIFPKTDQCPSTEDLECNEWEVVSHAEVRSIGIAGCLERTLKLTSAAAGSRRWKAAPAGLMSRIKSVLRRDFDLPISALVMREEEERRRIELTEQQYGVLSAVDVNGKALVTGAAGTGKTLLALEFARRELMESRTVGLFCFNRLLGTWLLQQADAIRRGLPEGRQGQFEGGTFQAWLNSVVNRNASARDLFNQTLAAGGEDLRWGILDECATLAIGDDPDQFDTIIIDEMQDFQNPQWLTIIDASLRGGLRDGRWAMFGDFSRQALYATTETPMDEDSMLDTIKGFGAYPVRLPLTINCRNTKRIAETTSALTGFNEKPYEVRGVEGKRVVRSYFGSVDQQFAAIREGISRFREDGFKENEIMLLWDADAGTSDFKKLATSAGLNLVEWGDSLAGQNPVRISSIQKFKGLEADAVIVCNVHSLSEDKKQKLYVAMSRARSRLILVLPKSLKAKVDEMLAANYGETDG